MARIAPSGSGERRARNRRAESKHWRRCNSKVRQSRICGGGWIGARSFTSVRLSRVRADACSWRERANFTASSPASMSASTLANSGRAFPCAAMFALCKSITVASSSTNTPRRCSSPDATKVTSLTEPAYSSLQFLELEDLPVKAGRVDANQGPAADCLRLRQPGESRIARLEIFGLYCQILHSSADAGRPRSEVTRIRAPETIPRCRLHHIQGASGRPRKGHPRPPITLALQSLHG